MRQDIHTRRKELMNTIMTVTFNNLMKPTGNNTKYSMFLPRCSELREDKFEADSLARVIEQFEAIIKTK
jgi:DNA ligase-1